MLFSGLMNTMKIEARRETETSKIDYYFISNDKLVDVINLVTLSSAKLENTFQPHELLKEFRLEELPFRLREKIDGHNFSNCGYQVCLFDNKDFALELLIERKGEVYRFMLKIRESGKYFLLNWSESKLMLKTVFEQYITYSLRMQPMVSVFTFINNPRSFLLEIVSELSIKYSENGVSLKYLCDLTHDI